MAIFAGESFTFHLGLESARYFSAVQKQQGWDESTVLS